ncbi:MAG: cupin domain-containing protein [Actinobacteria bacterium]|nr:cupin domain-containing protein [Actinomycetota bacterium]MBV8598245.1 cupin domain-containing protein [Actinomycetota bacterium]
MNVFADIGEVPALQIWDGVVARPVHAERMTMGLIELEPGAVVPEHSHGQEQIGILLAGSMTFTIGGETKTVGPGGIWTILADVPHSVEAGKDGAVAFEIFAPGRTDWRDLPAAPARAPRWPPPG